MVGQIILEVIIGIMMIVIMFRIPNLNKKAQTDMMIFMSIFLTLELILIGVRF